MQEIKLIYKELRNHPRFSIMYILTMFLGLVGLMIISNFNDSFKNVLASRSKQLLTADLAVVSRRALTTEESNIVAKSLEEVATKETRMVEMYHMASRVDGKFSRLIQIKSVSENYPLYGKIIVKESDPNFNVIHEGDYVVVDKDVLFQLKLAVGDKLRVGAYDFEIKSEITDDMSSSWRGISMAPKVYMSLESVKKTKLMGMGTVASYYQFYFLGNKWQESDLKKVKDSVEEKLIDPGVNIMTPDKASEQVGRVMNYLSDFLGLVSLVSLFLSIIGIVYMGQSYFFERLSQIGILRSLGMQDDKIRFIYQMKLFILAVLAWIFAYLFTYLSQGFIQSFLIKLEIPFEVTSTLSVATMIISLTLVIAVSFIVARVLTSKVFDIPTREILFGQKYFKWSWSNKDYILFSPLVLIFWALSIWQSQSLLVGSVFILSLFITSFILLFGFGLLLKFLSKHLTKNLSYPTFSIGMAIRSVARSPINSAISMWAIGIGVMLLALISQIESGLQNELIDDSVSRPSFFLFDIQPEQTENLETFAANNNIELTSLVPMVRARISKVNDEPYVRDKEESNLSTREEQRRRNFRNRTVNLSYENGPNDTVEIVEGDEYPLNYNEDKQDLPYMAIETRYADRMGFKIGDKLTFNILGVEVQAQIKQIRRIKWTSFQPNFFMVLQKGVIDDAPMSLLSTIKQMPKDDALVAQDKIVEKFHNISMINVGELIGKILVLFASMSFSIKLMAFLCIMVGVLVITAINRNQLSKQQYEISIQKILGLSWLNQLLMVNIGFLITTISATLLGVFASVGAAKIFSNIFFDGAWNFNWKGNLYIILFITFLTICTVTLGSLGILRKKPKVFLN